MINLLPPEKKENHRVYSLAYLVALIYVIVGVAIFLGAAGLVTYNLTMGASNAAKESRLQDLEEEKTRNSDISAKAAFIDDRLKSQASYQDPTKWSELLNAVAASTPTTVTLKSVDIQQQAESKTTVIAVTGNSLDRRSALLFKDKLLENKNFAAVTIKSINEVGEGGTQTYDFSIELTLAKDAFKK